jgi:hypothetical protein
MSEEIISVEDVRPDWAAYRREKQREATERMEVIMVTIMVAAFIVITLGSFFVRAHVAAKERSELVEMFEGGAK